MRTVLRNLLIVTFMAVCVAACGPSPEKLYQQGVEYYNNKDYTKAAECFSKAAKKGHTESEKYLAMMFEGNAPAEQTKEEEQIVEEAIEMEIIEENEGMIDDGAIEQMIVEEEIIRENDKPAKEEKPVVKENKPQHPKAGAGFSVSSTKRVYFAKGNLQYQASTKKWRFAEHQWDVLGEANSKISDKNNGWIDLFGWGTGSNPTKNSTNNKDYTSFSDWGKNPISNGGGKSWRTLSKDEWSYVLDERNTPSGIRYAKATVNGIQGLVLLPDNWNSSYYGLDGTNRMGADFDDNVINKTDWTNKFEAKGAAFLPNAGSRKGTGVSGINKDGYYWSSSNYDSAGAFAAYIYDRNVNSGKHYYHSNGFSVRLVRNAN